MQDHILEIRLSSKGIKPVRNGHPWVFRNALGAAPSRAEVPPDVLRSVTGDQRLCWKSTAAALVCDPGGTPLGWGIYNRSSRLALRMVTRNSAAPIHYAFFRGLLQRAVERRRGIAEEGTTDALRLVFGEADGFPGLVADLLGPVLVVEFSSAFAWENRGWITEILQELVKPEHVHLQPDAELLAREGISGAALERADVASTHVATPGGALPGGAPAVEAPWQIHENGLKWQVSAGEGQKTGFYCDQRENRRRFRQLARGATVLDAFCYHGGFGLNALAGGAEKVVFADSSRPALDAVSAQAALQGALQGAGEPQVLQGDLFEMLRRNDIPGGIEQFDLVVLDPPKLVPARQHREKGMRAYKDLNLSLFRHLKGGARVMTFSCSGAISRDDFRTTLAWAAADAGRTIRILETLGQPADHPVPLHFPEAEYLKGYLLQLE